MPGSPNKETRERKGVLDVLIRDRMHTIYSLSKKTGVSERTIAKLCDGSGPVRPSTVRKLAEGLEMPASGLAALLEGDGIIVGKL